MSSPSVGNSQTPKISVVIICLGIVYLVWGSTYLGIKFAVADIPPFILGAVRMFTAGIILFGLVRLKGEKLPTKKQWKTLVWLGLLMVLLSNGLVNLAETQVSSGLAAIAVASMPLFGALFASFRGFKPTKIEWIGLIVGFAGVLWLNLNGTLSATPLGLACLLIASIAWAWGSIWSRDQDLPSPFMSAACQMLTGSVWMAAAAMVSGERMHQLPSMHAMLATAYLIVFGSIIAFTAFVWINHNLRPALAHSYAYVNPPIAVLFGVMLGNEKVTPQELGAMVVILIGVVIITLAKAFRAAKPSASAIEEEISS